MTSYSISRTCLISEKLTKNSLGFGLTTSILAVLSYVREVRTTGQSFDILVLNLIPAALYEMA